jgi:hypothetical protein
MILHRKYRSNKVFLDWICDIDIIRTAGSKNTTQYVLDTAIHKQKQNNVNKTRVILQTIGGKYEQNIVFMRKS